MKTRVIKNIYGYPAITARILDYIKAHKYRLVIGTADLNELPESDNPTVVLAGLTMLDSFKIPVIGYTRMPNEVWHKCELPPTLGSNEIVVHIYRLGKPLPGTKKMLAFYRRGETDDTFSSGFLRSHQVVCLNSRVFKASSKEEPVAEDAED